MSDITIRSARVVDAAVLERLARLDSQPTPTGEVLLAEVCGQPVAALERSSGRAIADPFRPTADVVELLRVRASSRRRRGFGRRGALHPRLA